jgi:hypothetical protein
MGYALTNVWFESEITIAGVAPNWGGAFKGENRDEVCML